MIRHAPNQFCRVSHFLCLSTQHLFGASCGYYYDDVPSLDASFSIGGPEDRHEDPNYAHMVGTCRGSAQWCVCLLCHLVGYPMAAAKRQPPAAIRKFLGVISDFSDLLTVGVVKMYVSQDHGWMRAANTTRGACSTDPWSLECAVAGMMDRASVWCVCAPIG